MPTSPMSEVVRRLRRTAFLNEGAERTDGQLLACFVEHRDDAAFAALVRRHGPMVWGVCRRVLGNEHDAEDAFQATFLVLVRKAAAVRPRSMVGNWLYGVAYKVAQRARVSAATRRAKERQVAEMPEPALEPKLWDDLQPLLDRELNRLPDRYRAALVLCDLEGKTRKQAARQLGCPEGTVASRLATARRMLARRLTRRGVALSGAALAAALSQNVASAGVPTSVVASTIEAAGWLAAGAVPKAAISVKVVALTEGAMRAMLLTKLKTAMAGLLLAAALVLGATRIYQAQAAETTRASEPGKLTREDGVKQQDAQPEGTKDGGAKQPAAKPDDKAALQGTWQVVSFEKNGKVQKLEQGPGPEQKVETWTINGGVMTPNSGGSKILPHSVVFAVRPDKTPKEIDINPYPIGLTLGEADINKGIYTLQGDVLKICLHRMLPTEGLEPRPTEMVTKEGSTAILITLKRVKPQQPIEK